jgi:hypothetical protein
MCIKLVTLCDYYICLYRLNPKGYKSPCNLLCRPREGRELYLYLQVFVISALCGVGGLSDALAALPTRSDRYPPYRRVGGPQLRSGRVCTRENFLFLPRFEPRIIQRVANRYPGLRRPKVVSNYEQWL